MSHKWKMQSKTTSCPEAHHNYHFRIKLLRVVWPTELYTEKTGITLSLLGKAGCIDLTWENTHRLGDYLPKQNPHNWESNPDTRNDHNQDFWGSILGCNLEKTRERETQSDWPKGMTDSLLSYNIYNINYNNNNISFPIHGLTRPFHLPALLLWK